MNKKQQTTPQEEEEQINLLTTQFFDLFTNTNGRIPTVQNIKTLFLPNGILINNTTGTPAVYDLEGFLQPREEILTNGTLTNFVEQETTHTTAIFGNIAQRTCTYEKSGLWNGEPFTGKGKKLMQFVKQEGQWLLAAVTWSDQV